MEIKKKNPNLSLTLLQLIITGEELKKISISYNYGEVKNSLILTNEE